jgi:hypothetical protein
MTITSSSFGGGGAGSVQKWVSGTTYALDDLAWSPISYLTYIRKVAGAGATDPSADGTNWDVFGPSKIRQIQRGTLAITTTNGSGTAALGTAVLSIAKCELRMLGVSCDIDTDAKANDAVCRIALTNTTTITGTRSGTFTETATISWELTEWW